MFVELDRNDFHINKRYLYILETAFKKQVLQEET